MCLFHKKWRCTWGIDVDHTGRLPCVNQVTVQVAAIGEVKTDEGSLHSNINCLSHAAVNVDIVFLANFPTWEARISHKWHTFLENLGHQLSWLWCCDFQKQMGAKKMFGLSKHRTAMCQTVQCNYHTKKNFKKII